MGFLSSVLKCQKQSQPLLNPALTSLLSNYQARGRVALTPGFSPCGYMNLDLQLRPGTHWAQPCDLCWCLETHPETVLASAHPSIRGQPAAREVPLKSPPQRAPSSENFKNLPSGFLFTPHALSMKFSLNRSHWGRLVTVSPQGCILCGLAVPSWVLSPQGIFPSPIL